MNASAHDTNLNSIFNLERWINRALQLDEETLIRLAELEGKVIAFEFKNTDLIVYLFPQHQGVKFSMEYDEKPHVLIKGTPVNFISMMVSGKTGTQTMPADMELVGDIALAQRFQFIMQDLELDLEEPLSKWLGDTAAHQIGRFVRHSKAFAINTGKTIAMDISEYLRFENDMLPDDLLVKQLCDEIDVFKEDVDRLTMRLQKLQTKLDEKA